VPDAIIVAKAKANVYALAMLGFALGCSIVAGKRRIALGASKSNASISKILYPNRNLSFLYRIAACFPYKFTQTFQ